MVGKVGLVGEKILEKLCGQVLRQAEPDNLFDLRLLGASYQLIVCVENGNRLSQQ
ncbi:hypothetical protein D3C84_1091190 [compost metagenome]